MTQFENAVRRKRYKTRDDQPVLNQTDQRHDRNNQYGQEALHCLLGKPDTRINPGPEEIRENIRPHYQDASGECTSENYGIVPAEYRHGPPDHDGLPLTAGFVPSLLPASSLLPVK